MMSQKVKFILTILNNVEMCTIFNLHRDNINYNMKPFFVCYNNTYDHQKRMI